MENAKRSFWPQTTAGKRSVGLVIFSLLVMIILMIALNYFYFEPGTPPAIILGSFWTLMTIIAAITCIQAFWKARERSTAFLICSIIILLMFMLALIEIVEGIRVMLGLPV